MSRMFQFLQPPSKCITVILVLLNLITFNSGENNHTNVIEGEDTELYFSYPCIGLEVTLQHSYRAPFYDSANPESTALSGNKRLIVHEERDECSIRLEFTPALRSDAGWYILTLYHSHGRTFCDDTVMWLGVDYPPGTASCEWSEEGIVDDWVSLKCTAPAGSSYGEIACFQNGNRVPYLKTPVEVDGTLEQTLWARYSRPAFCCAVVIGRPVDRCDCKDYKWDPYKNVTYPCPVTTPQGQQHDVTREMGVPHVTLSPSYTPKPPVIKVDTKKPNINVTLHATYSFLLGALVLVIIGLIIALVRSRRIIASRRTIHVTRSSEATGAAYTGMHYVGQGVSRRIPWSVKTRSSEL